MQTSRKHTPQFIGRIVSVAAAFTFCSLSGFAQSSPPVMIQVPFVSAYAGDGSSSSLISPCTSSNDLKTFGGSNYGDGCAATQSAVNDPWGTAVDTQGNVYFGDEGHKLVRVVYNGNGSDAVAAMIEAANPAHAGLTPVAGDVYTLAGGLSSSIANKNTDGQYACGNVIGNGDATDSAGDGCPATQSYINGPYGAATDSAGDVFVVDRGNSLVRVVYNGGSLAAALITLENPSITSPQIGYIYNVVGKGGGYADGVLATAGEIHQPGAVTVDANENLYIADTGNSAVRMVNGPNNSTSGGVAAGYIHTIAGECSSSSCTVLSGAPVSDVAASTAAFSLPGGVAVDASGNVYVADSSSGSSGSNPAIRVIYAGGATNPAANLICIENGSSGYNVLSGSCSAASLQAGYVYTLAGGTSAPSASSGNGGLAAAGQLAKLGGLAVDASGNLYFGDYAGPSIVAEINAGTGYLYFLASDGQATSGTVSVGSYCAPGASGGPTALDADGDGCPGPQSYSHHIQGNLAVDAQGNIYYADDSDYLIRKLTFSNSFAARGTATASAAQNFAFMLLPQTTSATVTGVNYLAQGSADSEYANGGLDTCTGTVLYGAVGATQNNTCVVSAVFAPARAGARPGAIQVQASTGVLGTAWLSGSGNAAEIAIDPGSSNMLANGATTAQGIAADTAGNAYVAEAASGNLYEFPNGGSSSTQLGAGLSNPYQIAVDGAGNVYVADTGNNRIVEFASAGTTASTNPINTFTSAFGTDFAAPKGVALDASGDLFIADTGNGRVIELPGGNGSPVLVGAGFLAPDAVAADDNGNLYVADTSLNAIVKVVLSTGAQSSVALLSGAAPNGVAVDAAGNVYYTDATAKSLVEVPASGSGGVTVASGLTDPVGVALDPSGNLYVADAQSGAMEYGRTLSSQTFASLSDILSATLTNIGNESYVETQSAGLYYTQSDTTDFSVSAASANGCDFTSPLDSGTECGMSALFTPQATGTFTDDVLFAGNAVNTSSVAWDITGSGTVSYATTTTLSGPSPASPVFGQTVDVTVNVTSAHGTPTGDVVFTVDSTVEPAVALSSGSYVLSLTGLTAGPHTVSVTYSGGGSFSGSSATALNFSIAQAIPSISWTPPASSQTYGPVLGAAMLNATTSLPGGFAYTATQGSTTIPLTANSVLGGGAWTLTATFTPQDSVDYAVSTATAPYTVTTASTSAVAGPSDFVVAADGTGNYTSVAAAALALPSGGGAVYIKPGTYTENDILPISNLALEGLGDTPSSVVITDDLSAANGDQASATMQLTGSNVYVSNLTIQNTYDSENQAAYNSGSLGNSQALALWTTGDKQVYNNVALIGEQDTLFAGSQGCSSTTCIPARQYFFDSYITGNVDYIFGDGATVFDSSTIYTSYHGTPSGEATITAGGVPGRPGNYLSGEIMYNSTLTSESDAGPMTNLYLGRPWGSYATNIYVNTNMEAPVNNAGWIEFTPGVTNNLPTATYGEYDSTGAGAAGYLNKQLEQYAAYLTATQAAAYTPTAFLAGSDNWNPVTTLQADAAGFIPSASGSLTVNSGTSVTILLQVAPVSTPTLPTGVTDAMPSGQVTFYDGTNELGTATLGATGVAYLSTAGLSTGSHTITAQYAGDANYAASTSGDVTVVVTGAAPAVTTTTLTPPASAVYGTNATVTVSVAAQSGTPTGSVILSVDGMAQPAAQLNGSGQASITLSGLSAGNHALSAMYSGGPGFATSLQTGTLTIAPATLNIAVANASMTYGAAALPSFTGTVTGLVGSDQVTVTYSTTATAASSAGTYSITATISGTAAANYTPNVSAGTLTINPLALTTTATPVTVTYGLTIPPISGAQPAGVLVRDEGNVTAVFATTATSTSPVGQYPITVSLTGSAAGNYTIALTGSPMVTIQPATVTLAVNNATRLYGAANPAFSGVFTGVLAQDAANVAAVFSTSATLTSPVGTYSITATSLTGSAAGNYTLGAVTPGTLTVTQAGTTITLATSSATIPLSGNVTFTATVDSATSGTPTGSVTFYNGTTVLGAPSLSNGVAILSNPSITQLAGTYTITAVYSGDTNFTTSTSSPVTETVQLPIVAATPSVSSLSLSSGSSGTVTLTLAAQGGYTGTASFSCANLPAYMSCTFNPSTATFTSTSLQATTTLTISTSGSSSTTALFARPQPPVGRDSLTGLPALCFLLPGALFGLFGLRNRKMRTWQRRMMALLLLTGGLAFASAVSGCGGSSGSGKTPAGTYTINVEITAGTVQMVPLTVTVQ